MLGLRSIQRATRTPTFRQSLTKTTKRFQNTNVHQVHGPGLEGAADNAFNRERQAVKEHAAATSDLWRKLSIYVVIPALCIAGVNAWRLWTAHWEHMAHEPPVEERPEYPYMNIRTKNFFWGDGDKTLFWNPKVNHHKKDEE